MKYFPNTLRLVFIPLAIGLTLGTVIALVRVYKVPVLCKLLGIFVTVYQGVPIVVALMIYNLVSCSNSMTWQNSYILKQKLLM